jgi:Neisseria PilC beta-propeller domain
MSFMSLHLKQIVNWRRIKSLVTGLALIIGSVFVLVSAQSTNESPTATAGVADFYGQVTATSTGYPGSTTAFVPVLDTIQWNGGYLPPSVNVPQWQEHVINFPVGQPYKSGAARYPGGYAVSYQSGNAWSTNEPADGASITAVKFRYDPASITIGTPPSSTVIFEGAGDGWEIIAYNSKLYMVNHHLTGQVLKCHDTQTNRTCAGWPQSALHLTADAPIAHLDRPSGKLFFPVAMTSIGKVGFECFNLLTKTSCGSFPWANGNDQKAIWGFKAVGNKLYAATAGGSVNCIDVSTTQLCSTTDPARYPTAAGVVVAPQAPVVSGTKIYSINNKQFQCFDTATAAKCTGTWPVASGGDSAPRIVTDAAGNFKAICGINCVTATGAAYTRNANESAMSRDGGAKSKETLTYKNRIFSYSKDFDVMCHDLSTGKACPNFPLTITREDKGYSLALDAERQDCVWAAGHVGVARSFNPMTGGACTGATSVPLVLTASPETAYQCRGPGVAPTWKAVVLSRDPGAAVGVEIRNGITDVLIANRTIAAGQTSLDISDIPYATHKELKVQLNLLAVNTLVALSAEIQWSGPVSQFCVQTKTTATSCDLTGNWTGSSGITSNPTSPTYTATITGKGLSAGALLTGYAVSSAVSSTNLADNPLTFSGRFNERELTGDLLVTRLNSATAKQSGTLTSAIAVDVIPGFKNRQVLTQQPPPAATPDASTTIPLRWDSLEASQKSLLNRNLSGAVDAMGSKRLDYLRGDDANESSTPDIVPADKLRKRISKIGMVLGSGPVYVPTVAYQSINEVEGSGYAAYLRDPPRTLPMVFFAANDGMLYGMTVVDGGATITLKEQFAYLPRRLLSKINRYTDSTAFNLRVNPYFHDNTPMVNDIVRNGKWSTVLVSAFGRGAPGFAALDITNGDVVTESTSGLVIREFTDENDADMGYIVAQPTINGVGYSSQIVSVSDGGPKPRPAVVVGNGIGSANKRAALFVVFLDATGGYRKLVLPGSDNGLATPRVLDLSGDGIADIVYAGDLKGNVWSINISNTADMQHALLTTTTAPISSAPLVRRFAPDAKCINCTMVNVATGRPTLGPLLYDYAPGDHRLLGLLDKRNGTAILATDLVTQTINNSTPGKLTVNFTNVDFTTAGKEKLGWTMALPTNWMGSANPVDRGNGVVDFFTATKPGVSGTTCTATGGHIIALMSTTGNAPPLTFDTNNDGSINAADLVDDGSGKNVAVIAEGISPNVLGNVANVSNAGDKVAHNITADGTARKQNGPLNTRLRMGWQELDR